MNHNHSNTPPLLALLAIGLVISGCASVAANTTSVRVFHVDDFGAMPDGEQNSCDAILKAVAAAKLSGGAAEVVFGAGTYRIETEFVKKTGFFLPHCIEIHGAKDLCIRGTSGKTKLLVTNPKNGLFWVKDSERVTVDDLTVDYDPLPFSQGRITAVDATAMTMDVRLDDGYAELDQPFFDSHMSILTVFDPQVYPDLTPGAEVITAAGHQRVGDRIWRIASAGCWMKRFDPKAEGPEPLKSPYVRVGARIVFSARDGGGVLMFDRCTDTVVRRVTAYAAPGGFLGALSGRNLVVYECKVCPPEGSGRLMSTCADGIHVKNLRDALTIERCRLEKMGDDSINFHVTGLYVEKVVSPREFILNGRGFSGLVMPEDVLQIIDQQSGLRAEVTVVGLDLLDGGRRYQVRLDRPVDGVKSGTDRDADLVFNLTGSPSPFTVRDNYLASQTEILARGVQGVIENNTMETHSTVKPAIVMTYSGFPWYEGPIPRDVTIRNNTFIGQRIGQIWLDGRTGEGIRNVQITGNTFRDIASPMVWARGVGGILLQNNTIANGPALVRQGKYSCVVLDAAKSVVLDRLEVNDSSPKLNTVVVVGKRVAPGESGVAISGLKLNLSPTAKPVLDRRDAAAAKP